MKKYALLHIPSQQLVKYTVTDTSESEFCNSESFKLEVNKKTNQIWMVDDVNKASFARLHGMKWYCSSYDFPECNIDPQELKVVELSFEVKDVEATNDLYEKAMTKSINEGSTHDQKILDSYLKYKKKLSLKEMKTKYPHPGPEKIFNK